MASRNQVDSKSLAALLAGVDPIFRAERTRALLSAGEEQENE